MFLVDEALPSADESGQVAVWKEVAKDNSGGLSRGALALTVSSHISKAVPAADVAVYLVDEIGGTIVGYDGNEE